MRSCTVGRSDAEWTVIKLYSPPQTCWGSASRCSLTAPSPFWRVIMELQLCPQTGKYAAILHAGVLGLAATGIQLGAEYLPLHCCHFRSVFSSSLTCRHSLCQADAHTHTCDAHMRANVLIMVWYDGIMVLRSWDKLEVKMISKSGQPSWNCLWLYLWVYETHHSISNLDLSIYSLFISKPFSLFDV